MVCAYRISFLSFITARKPFVYGCVCVCVLTRVAQIITATRRYLLLSCMEIRTSTPENSPVHFRPYIFPPVKNQPLYQLLSSNCQLVLWHTLCTFCRVVGICRIAETLSLPDLGHPWSMVSDRHAWAKFGTLTVLVLALENESLLTAVLICHSHRCRYFAVFRWSAVRERGNDSQPAVKSERTAAA